MMWLVKVKLPGIMPRRLPISTKVKSVKKKGKYFRPSRPALLSIISAMKS